MFSASLGAIVTFGGLAPGARHVQDFAICRFHEDAGENLVPEWKPLQIMSGRGPQSRCHHGAALLERSGQGAQLLIFGGETARYPDGRPIALNDTWTVDLTTGEAAPLIPDTGLPPCPRMRHTCVVVAMPAQGDTLLVIGGRLQNGDFVEADDSLHMLHLDAKGGSSWQNSDKALAKRHLGGLHDRMSTLAPMQRHSHSAVSVANSVILFGGFTPQGLNADVVLISPTEIEAKKVATSGQRPSARSQHASVMVGSHMLISGGRDHMCVFGDVALLNLRTWTWGQPISDRFNATRQRQLATRHSHAAVYLGSNRVAIFGGYAHNGEYCQTRLQLVTVPPRASLDAVAPPASRPATLGIFSTEDAPLRALREHKVRSLLLIAPTS